jgi:release factor glutamine methyltransferase
LYTDFERPLSAVELADLKAKIRRRAIGEPLQYILGYADFYGNRIEVTPDVLIPRPETELIVEKVIKLVGDNDDKLNCLDVGTGSGCIPIAIAKRCKHTMWRAIDKETKALDVARRNVKLHELEHRISCERADFISETIQGSFHFITMNPPYISQHDIVDLQHEVRDYEPHSALTDDADGLSFYKRMARILPSILAENGVCIMELGFGQAPIVKSMYDPGVFTFNIYNDLQDIPRIAVVSVNR